MRTYDNTKIEEIISRYKKPYKKKKDAWVQHCLCQNSLKEVIRVAAQCADDGNLIHPHQKRLGRERLKMLALELLEYEDEISQARHFDNLLNIINRTRHRVIGKQTNYEIAFRIGCYLKLYPDRIYLHAGTHQGALNLMGKLPRNSFLVISELPQPFHRSDLEPWEIIEILSIYKDKWQGCLVETYLASGTYHPQHAFDLHGNGVCYL